MPRPVALYCQGFAARPAFDTAVSRALLAEVASGAQPEALRLHLPGAALALSAYDRVQPGFAAAVAAARARGFGAVLRLAGGRAALFHEGALAFAWCIPAAEPRRGIDARFAAAARVVARALRALGADARIGPVQGEYCPGAHSVNAGGRAKLAGIGQRLVRGAALVGGVLMLREAERARAVLRPAYAALGYEWRPETLGALEDVLPGLSSAEVRRALCNAWQTEARAEFQPLQFEAPLLRAAEARTAAHEAAH